MSDITIGKHHGNPASSAANKRVEPTKRMTRDVIVDFILRYPEGVTSEDVAEYLRQVMPRTHGWPPNCVSPRITEAKDEHRVMSAGLRRGRQILVRYEAQMNLLIGDAA